MFEAIIKPKLEILFSELRKKIIKILNQDSLDSNEYYNTVDMINSEISVNSKLILGDFLFELTNEAINKEFSNDISVQNKFNRMNLRSEIMANYIFTPNITYYYDKNISLKHSIRIMITSVVAIIILLFCFYFVTDIFLLDNFITLVISLIIGIIFGSIYYFYIEPTRNKQRIKSALNKNLFELEQQLLNWYNEIGIDFYNKVDDFKKKLVKE